MMSHLPTAEDGEGPGGGAGQSGPRARSLPLTVTRAGGTVDDCKSIVDGHNRPLQAEGLRSGVAEVWPDWTVLFFLSACSEQTDEGQLISLTAASAEGASAHKPATCFDQSISVEKFPSFASSPSFSRFFSDLGGDANDDATCPPFFASLFVSLANPLVLLSNDATDANDAGSRTRGSDALLMIEIERAVAERPSSVIRRIPCARRNGADRRIRLLRARALAGQDLEFEMRSPASTASSVSSSVAVPFHSVLCSISFCTAAATESASMTFWITSLRFEL